MALRVLRFKLKVRLFSDHTVYNYDSGTRKKSAFKTYLSELPMEGSKNVLYIPSERSWNVAQEHSENIALEC